MKIRRLNRGIELVTSHITLEFVWDWHVFEIGLLINFDFDCVRIKLLFFSLGMYNEKIMEVMHDELAEVFGWEKEASNEQD